MKKEILIAIVVCGFIFSGALGMSDPVGGFGLWVVMILIFVGPALLVLGLSKLLDLRKKKI